MAGGLRPLDSTCRRMSRGRGPGHAGGPRRWCPGGAPPREEEAEPDGEAEWKLGCASALARAGGAAAACWPRCRSSHSMARSAFQPPRCIAKSIAPPPPWEACQLKNFAPATESGPRGVRHWDLSWRSRTAPQEVKTTSNGISRTRSARRRKSSRVTAHSSGDARGGEGEER